ncbi:hypothetical protein Acor_83230 [Acrocarpospora corrugata]|uniref:NB-ARC domain-containing protein n=1 Tax=Acrocarpospora corrugata TaxID=35763 RepID=A0A5M3WBD1_9ACTN|nr:tetratricopeptide repeat protein [Acrocarpospora corrugata]GES06254.1 hypothetical protein Acor_83230 [Acrocarpospora corrugata]
MSPLWRRRSGEPVPGVSASGPGAVAVGGDNRGIISTGPNATNVQTVLPVAAVRPVTDVDAPPGMARLPAHSAVFVGRDDDLADLATALAGPGSVVVAAVHGLGGVGKSTLAARYAATHDFHPVWWITAETPAGVQAGLAALAMALQPELAAVLPPEALAERAVSWLAAHQGWLLVLDNVTNPSDITPLLERTLTGRVIVTTRLGEGWHRFGARLLRLDVLPQEQAVELLSRIAPGAADGAAELCAELGNLPLAVEQAAAYLHQTRLSPCAYLALLAEHPAVMYAETAQGADAERAIARIWRITLDRLATVPLTGDLLRILAWWAPEALPRSLLDGLAAPPDLQHALGALAAYNMITLDHEKVIVHRLVQAVARTADPADPHRRPGDIGTAREQATGLLVAALPDDIENPAAWTGLRTLLPHTDALTTHAPASTDTLATAHLLQETGLFLDNQGSTHRAITSLLRAQATHLRVHGDDHPDTLTSRTYLAHAYQRAGDLGRAFPLYQEILAAQERLLGRNHPDALVARANLAATYHTAGNPGQAIRLFKKALTEQRRALGDDDPATLVTRNNLAHAYQAAGDLKRAIRLFERTLADRRRVLGEDHPDTLASGNSLAAAHAEAGDLEQAIRLFEETLGDRQRVLGEDHPQTLASRNDLATAYEAAAEPALAIPMMEQNLADYRRVLGEDHPDILGARNNLAYAYESDGAAERAVPLYEQALAHCERVLGGDHVTTLAARNNLAQAWVTAGDPERAIPMLERNLADCERVHGEDHPHTLSAANNLANAHQEAGDLVTAIPLLEQSLADTRRVLGDRHPQILNARNNLAVAYQAAGDPKRAIALLEQNVAVARRMLTKTHPITLDARENLAAAHESAGDSGRAITIYLKIVTDHERAHGEDAPETLVSRVALAAAYQTAGDLDRAISLYEQILATAERILESRTLLQRVQGELDFTFSSRANLADAYLAARRPGLALPLHVRNLSLRQKSPGAYHPDPDTDASHRSLLRVRDEADSDQERMVELIAQTLEQQDHAMFNARRHLAQVYLWTGDPARAIPLYEQVVAEQRRVLGDDDLDTLLSAFELARSYKAAGHPGQAIPLWEHHLEHWRRLEGDLSVETLVTRKLLAEVYEAADLPHQAIPLWEFIVDLFAQTMGDSHPDALPHRHSLARARRAAGDPDRAAPLYERVLADCVRVLGEDHELTRAVRDDLREN